MRKKIVAGNWKMNMTISEGAALVKEILEQLPGLDENKQVIIAPPFLNVAGVAAQVANSVFLSVAGQNCHHKQSGAYTGEVSAAMLKAAGAQYVLVGHSERRAYNNESNDLLAAKTDAALAEGLQVIFCCGEPLEVRDADTQNTYVARQIEESLFHLNAAAMTNVVIAYEPIWAIGTGRTASAEQAQEMHRHIRATLANKYGVTVADATSILYGGSCKPSNAPEIFAGADVDGGLIGGAALTAQDFTGIITALN